MAIVDDFLLLLIIIIVVVINDVIIIIKSSLPGNNNNININHLLWHEDLLHTRKLHTHGCFVLFPHYTTHIIRVGTIEIGYIRALSQHSSIYVLILLQVA